MAKKLDRTDQLIDEILKQYKSPEEILGENGIFRTFNKRLAERVLEAEMQYHLGYAKHDVTGNNSGNSRNGTTSKTVRCTDGQIELEIPRDRNSSFEPILVKKGERQLRGFDERIVSLYARGCSTRDIQAHFEEVYGVEVSPMLISKVTNDVMQEVIEWQNRTLDAVYPIVYLDCLMVHCRDSGMVRNKAVYLALGVNRDGEKELLGLWMAQTEGAKFWLSVMTELKNRGIQDILVACVDGLKGFPEAIEAVYPQTQVQLCVVHQIRNSLRFVSYKHRKEVVADLRLIYGATTVAQAELALQQFGEKWDKTYPNISKSWQENWNKLSVFFDYPDEIKRAIYTTNAIESLNASLRKVTNNKKVFPNDESLMKLLYLAINNISKKWTMPIKNWKLAMGQFTIRFGDRFPL